jgi:hypothetical protein
MHVVEAEQEIGCLHVDGGFEGHFEGFPWVMIYGLKPLRIARYLIEKVIPYK